MAAGGKDRRRVVRALRRAVLPAALISALIATPALAATGAVSGTVTGPVGQPLSGAAVTVTTSGGAQAWFGSTEADGTYTVGSLPSGAYTVTFAAPGYLTQYYSGAASAATATPVSVTDGATTAHVDARLAQSGSIAGTVTDADGAPLAGIDVTVSDAAGDEASTRTAADGTYSVGSLSAGSYAVKFAPDPAVAGFDPGGGNYLPQYYDARPSPQTADPVTVTGGATTSGIDAHLQAGGQISGQVLDGTGAPVNGVLVIVYASRGEQVASWYTDADGRYSIGQLQSGSYAVGFQSALAGYPPNDLPQFYPGRVTLAGAGAVVVTAGQDVSGIGAHVSAGGEVTGTVTDPGGHAVAGADVSVGGSAGGGDVQTGTDGTYTVVGLASGSYTAEFRPPLTTPFGGPAANFLSSYFGGAGPQDATPLAVTAGTTTSGVNGTLPYGGELTGTVTDSASKPVANVGVSAYDADGGAVYYASTGSDGTYTVAGLPSGSYRLQFSAAGHAPAFSGGANSLALAAASVVAAGAVTSGVDVQLQPGATISGTVTGPGGVGLGGISVSAFDAAGAQRATAVTAPDGRYSLTDLAAGSFRVSFRGESSGLDELDYAPQFFPGQTGLAAATAVAVAAGATVGGIDAQLSAGGSISGTVTDGSGLPPIDMFQVNVIDPDGSLVADALVEPDGTYTVGALATGTYRLLFEPMLEYGGYQSQYLGGATLAAASGVSVTAGATTANVDMQVSRAPGSIAGTVTDAAGRPLNAAVTVDDASSGAVAASADTAPDGTYAVSGLAPGFYRVGFSAGSYSGFYGGASTSAPAGAVLVVAGATAAGIDLTAPFSVTTTTTTTSSPNTTNTTTTTATPSPSTTTTTAPSASGTTSSATTTAALPQVSTTSTRSGVAAAHAVVKAKPLTEAQKRVRALAACAKLKKSRQPRCVAAAEKRYPLKKGTSRRRSARR